MDTDLRRLFIALPVDDEKLIHSLAGTFQKYETFLNIVPLKNYHITIKFFGSVESGDAGCVIDSFLKLNHLQKVNYKIEGLGAFPSADDPSVIWAGLKCDERPFAEIIKSIEVLASSAGFASEKKRFIPHLTLARVKREKKISPEFRDYINEQGNTFFGSSVFSELVLFESILKSSGAEYKAVETVKLI